MRIPITTNTAIPEIPSFVDLEDGTLRHVLHTIFTGLKFADEIMDPVTGEMRFEGVLEVRLNETPYRALPEGLDVELRDGDVVRINLMFFGGG